MSHVTLQSDVPRHDRWTGRLAWPLAVAIIGALSVVAWIVVAYVVWRLA